MKFRSFSLRRFIYLCLIVFSIIPDVGIKFSVGGFTWTAYRLVVLLSVVVTLPRSIWIRKSRTNINRWVAFMAFWSVYGIILLVVGRYSDIHNGFIEWLSIFNGLIVIYIIGYYLGSPENRRKALRLVYWLLNIMVIFGLYEIATGKHWMTSAYYDDTSSVFLYSNTHQATGFMYNMNDFSAMITCMTPVLIDPRFGKKRIITLIGVLFINFINDATACTFALMVFAGFYYLIVRGGKSKRAFLYKIVFWILLFFGVYLIVTSGAGLVNRNDFIGAMARQIFNAKKSNGSLYVRLIMYRDAFSAWRSTGMLGMGPSGYANYFATHASQSGLVNPHSLILEILSEYGIIIAEWFIWLLIRMYGSAKKMYDSMDEGTRTKGLMVIAFIIIYFIASFAPSTFIGYAYQWVLIAIMCTQLDSKNINGGYVICSILH